MIDDFYTVISHQELGSGLYRYVVTINPECKVYQGHFPGHPVAPGVCLIAMVSACARECCGLTDAWVLRAVKTCRLLRPILPQQATPYVLDITTMADNTTFKAKLHDDETAFMTLEATFDKL